MPGADSYIPDAISDAKRCLCNEGTTLYVHYKCATVALLFFVDRSTYSQYTRGNGLPKSPKRKSLETVPASKITEGKSNLYR